MTYDQRQVEGWLDKMEGDVEGLGQRMSAEGKGNKIWKMADGWLPGGTDGRTDGIIHCCLAALCGWCFDSVRFDGESCVWWWAGTCNAAF